MQMVLMQAGILISFIPVSSVTQMAKTEKKRAEGDCVHLYAGRWRGINSTSDWSEGSLYAVRYPTHIGHRYKPSECGYCAEHAA